MTTDALLSAPCDPLCHSPGWHELVLDVAAPAIIAAAYASLLSLECKQQDSGCLLWERSRPAHRLRLRQRTNDPSSLGIAAQKGLEWVLPLRLERMLPEAWSIDESYLGMRCRLDDGPWLQPDDELPFACSLRVWTQDLDSSQAFYQSLGWMVHRSRPDQLLLHPLLGKSGGIELLTGPMAEAGPGPELHFPVWRLQRLIHLTSHLKGLVTRVEGPLGERLIWRLNSPEGLQIVFYEDL